VTAPAHQRTVGRAESASRGGASTQAVFLDLDTVLLVIHQGRRGVELGVQADLEEAIDRLSEVVDKIVVLVDPPPAESLHGLETERRLEALREGLGQHLDRLLIVTCPHGEERTCTCAKPDSGLVEIGSDRYGVERRGGWYIGADAQGIICGRTAGLRTIRIGPAGEDHLSAVHRPDYEARDLLDAANHILLEELAG
jgi:hypothetical protein